MIDWWYSGVPKISPKSRYARISQSMLKLRIWFLPSNFLNKYLFLLHSSGAKYVSLFHDDVIKWKHFLCYWSFEWGINQSIVDSPLKGQCREALMFSVMFAWPIEWTTTRDASDLRSHHGHYDVTVMHWFRIVLICITLIPCWSCNVKQHLSGCTKCDTAVLNPFS